MPEPEPEPEPEPRDPRLSFKAPGPMFDEEPEPEPASRDELDLVDDSAPLANDEGPALSQKQLDDMFGSDAEPEPIESFSGGGDDRSLQTTSLDDLEEPEPIPEVFKSPESVIEDDEEILSKIPSLRKKQKKGGSVVGKVVAVMAAILVGGIVAGAIVAREEIVKQWPDAAGLYEMIGLEAEPIGAGLTINKPNSDRVLENGKDVLVVTAQISNVTDQPRPVPHIRVALFNAGNEEVQAIVVAPVAQQVAPGETLNFTARLVEPAATARRLEVTFVKAEMADGKGK